MIYIFDIVFNISSYILIFYVCFFKSIHFYRIWKGYSVKKGPNYAPKRRKPATDLTRENLQSGEWKELLFKEYNFLAKGFPVEGGYLHPLLKARILFVIFDIL
ncbi:putative phenylalanine--tRNA ligase [Helianthus annuus]|nr:putative phenylalanine--tRNA ligase [Helianthus annuus]